MKPNNHVPEHKGKARTIAISSVIIVGVVYSLFYAYQKMDRFSPSCITFSPSKDLFEKLTEEECIKNAECSLSAHLAIDGLQTLTVADLGSKTKNFQELQKTGYNVYNPKNTSKNERYGTVLEVLTHGEASISLDPISLTSAELDEFNKNSIQKNFISFLRKTFDDHSAKESMSLFSIKKADSCHIVNGEIFGLDGFDPKYYKSRFVPVAVYEHITSGYDVFILFVDKPDRLFRAWIAYDKNGNYELRTIKDSSVPKEEVDALYKSFKEVIKDKRFSI